MGVGVVKQEVMNMEPLSVPVVQSEADAMMSVIERIASNPDADIEKLERLLSMRERVMDKQAEAAFNCAMSAAQSEMGIISRDAENSQTKSRYATYGKMDRELRPLYTKHGFALSYGTEASEKPDYVTVVCYVTHSAGYTRKYTVDMPADGKGAKGGDVMTKTHASGAAMSYGQRYLLKLIFNVAIGEDDNDGNGPGARVTDFQANVILRALTDCAEEIQERFASKYGDVKDVPRNQFTAVLEFVKKERGNAGA